MLNMENRTVHAAMLRIKGILKPVAAAATAATGNCRFSDRGRRLDKSPQVSMEKFHNELHKLGETSKGPQRRVRITQSKDKKSYVWPPNARPHSQDIY
mmetsp:Transcript_59155/g.114140  ORF Transcript_59155/g.114140 Transcript_59155/m.114140 type:complete len:98 (+) Transcript_59155:56-349(+)